MWYFAWILGLPLAAAFAVLNAMWYELIDDQAKKRSRNGTAATAQSDGAALDPGATPFFVMTGRRSQ
jgi:cyd operon protein YbgT